MSRHQSGRAGRRGPATARSRGGRIGARLAAHRQTAAASLGRIRRRLAGNLMTMAVIGIALLLPALLFLALGSVSQLGDELRRSGQLQIYLQDELSEEEALLLREELLALPEIDAVEYISRAQAAADFARYSGLGDVLESLSGNPLPASLQAQVSTVEVAALQALAEALGSRSEVEQVQMDLQWLQRLEQLLLLAQRLGLALILILALAVLFVVGNTIRLAVADRRAEIMVVKLVGGTDAFVARPFLYAGFWLGLGGGIMAALMLGAVLLALQEPINRLASSYAMLDSLQGPQPGLILSLLGAGAALGWLGASITVRRQLRQIEPH